MSENNKTPHISRNTEYSNVKKSWETWAESHKGRQRTNPFSEGYSKEVHNLPLKGDRYYGRPRIGSKTEYRGKKAEIHINEEVVGLCEAIGMVGEELGDGSFIVDFGTLFKYYSKVSFNVVGLLIRARKKGLVEFEGEMLYQGQDDDEPILLVSKPHDLIREIQEAKLTLSNHSSIGKKF